MTVHDIIAEARRQVNNHKERGNKNMSREIEIKSRIKSPVFWIGLVAASKLKR